MTEGTPTAFPVSFVCSRGHEAVEVVVRVRTIVRLSNGKETAVPLPPNGGAGTVSRDVPPGRPVMPLRGVPADRQRDKYEFKCPRCKERYELRSERALALVVAATRENRTTIDLHTLST